MRSPPIYLLLLVLAIASRQGVSDEAANEEDAEEQAQKNADHGVFSDGIGGVLLQGAMVDLTGGDEKHGIFVDNPVHEGGFEAILQSLERQMELADVDPPGDAFDKAYRVSMKFASGKLKGIPDTFHNILELSHGAQGSSRRRQAVRKSKRWDKGVVPFSFTDIREAEQPESEAGQKEIRRAMSFLADKTCLTFPEWSNSVPTEYGLNHSNYLRHMKPDKGGCWSFVGNGRGEGQAISNCASFGVALHEIMHAIGFNHEQDRGDRELFVAMHPENSQPKYKFTFSGSPNYDMVEVRPYDLGSTMQYGMYGFSINGLRTISVKDPEKEFLLSNKEGTVSHYDLMGINDYYDCAANCAGNLKCENDGYMNSDCKCQCSQLFKGEHCEKLYSPGAEPIAWPHGLYGLPMTKDGCPDGDWDTGSRGHATEKNSKTSAISFVPEFTSTFVEDYFCIKSDEGSGSDGDWPKGVYCIYRKGDSCPKGFEVGWIRLDDDNEMSSQNNVKGTLPDGEYGEDTKYYYCCRYDNGASDAVEMPLQKPFNLLRYGSNCQSIKGMLSYAYYVRYDVENTGTTVTTQTPHPSFSKYYNDVWLYHCYYAPMNYDCGGIIDLTTTKPSATITSPNYPQNYNNASKCIWYIKGPDKSHLVIDFDDFDIEVDPDTANCVDSVEVRSTLIGQPGERYCAEEIEQSIISVEGFMMVVLRTSLFNSRRGFNATVRIIGDDEQCINPEDFGASYRGQVDYTEQYRPCIKWEDAKGCEVSPFEPEYIVLLN